MSLLVLGKGRKIRVGLPTLRNDKPSRSRQREFSDSPNKEREAVVSPLSVSMHTGQIILLTKMLSGTDLGFYDFSTGKPVHTWQANE
jgi:hypothetical protein